MTADELRKEWPKFWLNIKEVGMDSVQDDCPWDPEGDLIWMGWACRFGVKRNPAVMNLLQRFDTEADAVEALDSALEAIRRAMTE